MQPHKSTPGRGFFALGLVLTIATALPAGVRADEPSDEIMSQIRGGGLGRFGLLAGVALVSNVSTTTTVEVVPGFTAMPFLAIMPFHWIVRGDESRAYCAAETWGAGLPPQDIANRAAVERTREILHLDASATPTYEQVLDATGWDQHLPARCTFASRFGFYIGVPVPYTTRVVFEGVAVGREVITVGGGGLLFAFPPYLTLHAGFSAIAFENNADPADLHYDAAFTFGLGSTLDVFDFLLSH